MVWDCHLFKNVPQFIVIHTVKGFGIVNKTKIDVFLELSCFFNDPADVRNLISGSSVFSLPFFFFFFDNDTIVAIFFFSFIFKLYNIVLVLPNIEMNLPQVYMCFPS